MTYDAGNRSSVREREKAAARADRERREWLANAIQTSAGRKYFYDLLASCHIFESLFNDSPQRLSFLEGERNVGLRIFSDLMASEPEALILMLREQNERNSASSPAPTERPSEPDAGRDVEGRERTDIDAGINDDGD